MKIKDEFSGTLTLTENSTKELFRVLKEQDETFISDVLDRKYGFTLKSADGRSVKLIPADDEHETITKTDALKAIDEAFDFGDCYCDRYGIKGAIQALPSAGRPQRWIPCSERLPTKAGHYLCSFKKPKRIDNIHVELAYWTGGRWYGYLAPEIEAWMPLPEPWKGADDDF